MKLYYKNNEWEILAPNTIALLKEIMYRENKYKNYLTLKQCSRILYTINQAYVVWNDDNYIDFIGHLSETSLIFYTTKQSNSKGTKYKTEKSNVVTIKNDFEYILKLFSSILPSMIIDRKFRLYIGENNNDEKR